MAHALCRKSIAFFLPFILIAPVLFAQEGLSAGMEAPDFKLTSVSGKTVTLREFQHKSAVIVHFWKSK